MVFGLFSKGGSLKRAKKKALSKFAQSPERLGALERLVQEGDEESLLIVCKRFSFTSQKLIKDEEEKAWVVRTFIEMGKPILPVLRKYMETAEAIAFPLRVVEEIADNEEALEIVDSLLEKEDPEYALDVSKRIALFTWVAELEDISSAEAVKRIAPYLGDFDESVRFAAAEAMNMRPCPEAAEPLISALLNDSEESQRFLTRVLEILEEHGLSIEGHRKEVEALVKERFTDFRVQKNKVVKRKL